MRNVNDNTRRQWDNYQAREVHCAGCAWLLWAFVAEHTAATGVSRPGDDRLKTLTRRSKKWVTAHKRHLERDGHIVLVSEGRWRGRRAAEYALPWLHNVAPSKGGAKEGAKEGTPYSLKGVRRGGRAQAPADAAAPRRDAVAAVGDLDCAEACERCGDSICAITGCTPTDEWPEMDFTHPCYREQVAAARQLGEVLRRVGRTAEVADDG